jgi:hypothetical protein
MRVERPTVEAVLADREQRLRRVERNLADPAEWVYVGNEGPLADQPWAPDFQNGFFNVGGSRVPLRYRWLRPYDVDPPPFVLDDAAYDPHELQVQGSVAGGASGLTIFTVVRPYWTPDGVVTAQAVHFDYDRRLTAHDDDGALVVVTIQGATGDVVYGAA